MNDDQVANRTANLLSLVSKCLHDSSTCRTERFLGDRKDYIGMSDIGRGLSCMRSAVGHKLAGRGLFLGQSQSPRGQHVLAKQIRLERGHWFESGLSQAFRMQNLPVIEQLEIETSNLTVPIKAHLDFMFASVTGQPTIRILELKSCEHIPSTLYSSYETQVYGQIGLLCDYWNQPAFSVRDQSGHIVASKCTFPEICRHQLGVHLPTKASDVDMEAWVLCLSMGDAQAFGPYLPNSDMLNICLNTAADIWRTYLEVKTGLCEFQDVQTVKGFYPLCEWCDFNADCPKFCGELQEEWDYTLSKLSELKRVKNDLGLEISSIEDGLKTAYQLSDVCGRWISSGNFRFKVSEQSGRRSLNKEKLRLELMNILGEEKTDEIFSRCEAFGKPFERLFVSAIA